jgi:DNA invertase Pin-like site-specific DNA recombinase
MQFLYLKPIHQRILDMLIMGKSHKEIAQKLGINVGTLYSYIRDMNFNNDCNIYQLIWNYAHLGEKYLIKNKKNDI